MKKIFSFLLLLSMVATLSAQDFEQMKKMRNMKLRVTLQDSKTKQPISFAAVYLVPQGDTVVTNFAITDDKGFAAIDDIVQRKYQFHAEIIGYKPVERSIEMKVLDWEAERNLGVITMEEDVQQLNAAVVSANGNPVVMKRDTLIYNASAYHVVDNAMLVDLLKKMPGMKIGNDGSVTVNGEKVDKITVGGKSFFIKDPSIAVKNLPAKIVNKVQVIDRKKEDAEFTGVGTKDDQEKVMDLELKECK